MWFLGLPLLWLFLFIFCSNRNICLHNYNAERLNILKGKVNRNVSEIIVLSVPLCVMKYSTNFLGRSERRKKKKKTSKNSNYQHVFFVVFVCVCFFISLKQLLIKRWEKEKKSEKSLIYQFWQRLENKKRTKLSAFSGSYCCVFMQLHAK